MLFAWPIAFASTFFQFGAYRSPHATLDVMEGRKACHEVRLPACWHDAEKACIDASAGSANLRYYPERSRYVFRHSSDDAVLMGYEYSVGNRIPNPMFSRLGPDFYVLNIGTKVHVRRASRSDWDAGGPIAVTAKDAIPSPTKTDFWDDQGLHYAGKLFPKRGPLWSIWDVSSISEQEKYLTVHSWDGTAPSCDQSPFVGPCESYGDGHYWIDLYQVATARKLIAMTGRFQGLDVDFLFANTQWLGDKYFVMPLQPDLRRFVLCEPQALEQ